MTETPSGINEDPNPVDPNSEAAIANRSVFRTGESLTIEQVVSAENPKELFEGLRSILKRAEDGNIPSDLEDRYGLTRLFGMMQERRDLLKMTPVDLQKEGYIIGYDEKTGVGFPKKRKYAPLALSTEEEPVIIEDRNGIKRQIDTEVTYNFGTPEQRKELADAYEKAVLEVQTRVIFGAYLGLRMNPETRDGLETLVVYLRGGRTPKLRADHLRTIFNLPSVSELGGEKPKSFEKATELGDQIEAAMICNLIMLNCGTREKMQDLLDRPGTQYLIARMAKDYGNRHNKAYTADDWIKENIGDYKDWVKLDDRTKDTYTSETRGSLTKWSNIPALYDDNFDGNEEVEFIENTIGNLVGSVEASWLAASIMRVIGAYASEGYLALKDGPGGKFQSQLQLGEDGFISGDDTGKYWTYIQAVKEGTKGRNSFLAGMIGKVPDMAMNLFDWCQIEVRKDGGIIKRSIWDAWLGTPADKDVLDILTLKPTGMKTTEEGYHRLGDLDFSSLRKDFHGKFATMQWLMGSGERPTGVVPEAWRTKFRPDDFELVELWKVRKYAKIVFNPLVLTKGSTHLFDTSNIELLHRNYLRNLMLARINSFSFSTNVLPSGKKMFNPEGRDTSIPDPLWIKMCISEILKPTPNSEEDLKSRYMDKNKKLRSLGSDGGPGKVSDVDSFLTLDFSPEDPKERQLAGFIDPVTKKWVGFVGKVTGKTYF